MKGLSESSRSQHSFESCHAWPRRFQFAWDQALTLQLQDQDIPR